MLSILLAPDSFKESMPAEQVCMIMKNAIHKVLPDAQCILNPMADGGEGTIDALVMAKSGLKIACEVQGPFANQRVMTHFGLIDQGQTAVIEMAKANGIHLIPPHLRNPLFTNTVGTGQLIAAALEFGVKKIIIGLGGSVTNDGGAGMAHALGVKFINQYHEAFEPTGGNLNQIDSIDVSQLDPRLTKTDIVIASDVNNPLCGPLGASYIFGPQKGATPEMVQVLDHNLLHFAGVVEQQLLVDLRHRSGAGAAGGLGFGLMAFTGADIRSGAELIIEETQLAEKIAQADYVFTGEGKIDAQTQFGKTPFAVAQVAYRHNKPVFAFAGRVGEGVEPLYEQGFHHICSINPLDQSLSESLKNAVQNLDLTVQNIVRQHI